MLLKRQVCLINESASCRKAFKSKSAIKESRARPYDDYVTNVDRIPELKEIMEISATEPITFIPPPYDANTPIRATAEMREAKAALLQLNFGDMLDLVRHLRAESSHADLALYSQVGYPRPVKPWWCFRPRKEGEEEVVVEAAPAPVVEEAPKEKAFNKDASFSIRLLSYPDGNKIKLLKEVRKLKPGMDIMASKKLVEEIPQIIISKLTHETLKEWTSVLDPLEAKYELIE